MMINNEREKQIFTAITHGISHEGRGIAAIEGKTIFIDGALKDETVTFSLKPVKRARRQKKHKRFEEGQIETILLPSKDRSLPPCVHFMQCGGCSLQHMSESGQIEFKQEMVLEQLRHFGGVEAKHVLMPPILGKTLGYRRRARLGVKYVIKKGGVLVGFREKQNHYIADLNSCSILHPDIGNLISDLKILLTDLEACKAIPQIEVAVGDSEKALVFRNLISLTEQDKNKLREFGRLHNLVIFLQPGSPDSLESLWPHEHSGLLKYRLDPFNIDIQFGPLDFTQVNAEINQQMVSRVIECMDIKPEDEVLDLFCGLGNFTLPMARFAKAVCGIEGSSEMVQRAYANANYNEIKNVEFHMQNLQDPQNFLDAPWLNKHYDKILLDPPRSGALELIPFLTKLIAAKVVYISCNPSTLARDLGEWLKNGYIVESLGILDMFPHTTHVETMAVLIRDKKQKNRGS